MPDVEKKTAVVYCDDLRSTTCRGKNCGATITKLVFVASGRQFPYKGTLVAEPTGEHDGRPTMEIDLAMSHFVDCPDAASFKRRTSSAGAAAVPATRAAYAVTELNLGLDALRSIYRKPPADLETAIRTAAESIKRALGALQPKDTGRTRPS
jgi:hypothetical protein